MSSSQPERDEDGPTSQQPGLCATRWAPILFLSFAEQYILGVPTATILQAFFREFGAHAFVLNGVSESSKGLIAFLIQPAIGLLSDMYGRKPLLAVCVLGMTLPYTVLMAGITRSTLIAWAVINALSGCFIAVFGISNAYITDLVPPLHRAGALGINTGLSLALGRIPAILVGAQVSSRFGEATTCSISVAIGVIVGAATALYLPESLARHHRKQAPLTEANPCAGFKLIRRPNSASLLLPCLSTFFFYTAFLGVIGNMQMFMTAQYDASLVDISFTSTIFGPPAFLAQVGVFLLRKLLGKRAAVVLGCASAACAYFVMGSARDMRTFQLAMVPLALSFVALPFVTAMVSAAADASEQGLAQGLLSSFKALAEGFGPLLFGGLLTLFAASPVPSLPIYLGCLLCAVAAATILRPTRHTAPWHTVTEAQKAIEAVEATEQGGFALPVEPRDAAETAPLSAKACRV